VKLARERLSLAVGVLGLPLQVFGMLWLLRFMSGTRPYQLGLTTHRAGKNALQGALGWVVLAPPVLGLFFLVRQLFLLLSPEGVREHAFKHLSECGMLTPVEFGLVVVLAMVGAPVVEEPLFVLALGLGWLAWRTQSLIGPMVLHSLFNGIAC